MLSLYSLGTKYEYIGGTLRIKTPDESDVGAYQCVVLMDDGSVIVSNFGNISLACKCSKRF